jgi:hypothetical protein
LNNGTFFDNHSKSEPGDKNLTYQLTQYLFVTLKVLRRSLRLIHLKKKAVFSAHGAPDLKHRHLPAFESHDPASMGKLRIPCDIIVKTFMAGGGHGTGRLFLVTHLRLAGFGGQAGCLS